MNEKLKAFRKGWDIFRPFKKAFVMVLVFQGVIQILQLASPFLLGKVLNGMQAHRPIGEILILAGFMLLTSLVSMSFSIRKDIYELRHIDFSINAYLTDKTLSKILSLSIGQHKSQNSGITQSVVSQGQSSLEQMLRLGLYNVIPLVAEVVITVGFLLWFNLLAGTVVLVGTVIYVFLALYDTKRVWTGLKALIDLSHKTRKSYSEILENTSLVQVSSQENRIRNEHGTKVGKWAHEGQELWIGYHRYANIKNALAFVIRFLVLVIGIFLVYKRGYRFGDFLILTTWTAQSTSQLWNMANLQRQWIDLWGQVKKYFAILDVEPAVQIVSNPVRPEQFVGKVEFRNVSFTYPEQRYVEIDDDEDSKKESKPTLPALVDVSFTIEAGERVAFVGESGAGKSTLVNLLVRGYDPDHGQILVDDHDLRLVDLRHFRESIGLVEQNVALFDNTLLYNTLFGLNGHEMDVTESELEKVSKEACIDRFNHRLTKGWDTWIGKNGVKLSGGEKQRVGIARALIKKPNLLILDEATSSLDAVNESMIKEAVRNASIGRTTIIIAHRLSTVRDVDKIFVMSKGSIAAVGTHEELIFSSPTYKELVTKQLFAI